MRSPIAPRIACTTPRPTAVSGSIRSAGRVMGILSFALWATLQAADPTPATPAPTAPAPALEASAKSPGWTATLSPADARLITQPRPLDGGVGLISRLRPKRYLLHTGQLFGNGRVVLDADPIPTVGLIAQETVPAVPEAVYPPVDDAKDFWLLDYTRLVPVLVRAVQEQQADLQSKESRIHSLENQLGNLEAELAKLKEITRVIDDSTRAAVAGLRSQISNLASKVSSLDGNKSCSCSK